jgi:hypothetical protein
MHVNFVFPKVGYRSTKCMDSATNCWIINKISNLNFGSWFFNSEISDMFWGSNWTLKNTSEFNFIMIIEISAQMINSFSKIQKNKIKKLIYAKTVCVLRYALHIPTFCTTTIWFIYLFICFRLVFHIWRDPDS